MSWEANIWAVKQRMKLPQEQLVLIVLGNCADPDAVAFSTWPGRDHWWKYLSKITRLSRSSLFRHINTIVALGLASRSMLVLADGSKRPTITLNLDAKFDIEKEEGRYIDATSARSKDQSHSETHDDEGHEQAENANDDSALYDEIVVAESESHHETDAPLSPTSGTQSVPSAGPHIDSSKSSSKDSPPTPSGGFVRDELWDRFVKAWGEPIAKFALARSVWDDIPTALRGKTITAARGYWGYRSKQPKPPAAVSAQAFLRDEAGWSQWLPFAPDVDGVVSVPNMGLPLHSPQGRAIVALHEIAKLSDYIPSVLVRKGVVNYFKPISPRIAALADAPPKSSWIDLTRQQAAAWEEFLRETIAVPTRKHLREGDHAPHPWPPKIDGTWSPTGPPL